MFNTVCKSEPMAENDNAGLKKRPRPVLYKRAQSVSPIARKPRRTPSVVRKIANTRRCQSLSPSNEYTVAIRAEPTQQTNKMVSDQSQSYTSEKSEKEPVIPQCILTKTLRALATKKREFIKLRKNLIAQQNTVLEHFAAVKELESRAGMPDESLGEMRILSLKGWPAHDLLLLVRDDFSTPINNEIDGVFGPQVWQQLVGHLQPIPEEVLGMGADIMARRLDMLNMLRCKHRNDRSTYLTNLEWKTKNHEFDNETEQLHKMVVGTAENLKAKINYSMDLAKIPWIDRDAMIKKIERVTKENLTLQHKIEELIKKEQINQEIKERDGRKSDVSVNHQALFEELKKEREVRESLKEVVNGAESMLRVARARIVTLERQLKEVRTELDTARRKYKDMEQLYRNREFSYDARSKKMLEVSKTGEMTIEALSRQRDALEIRVKELREIAENAERTEEARQAELKAKTELLEQKIAEQERNKNTAEGQVAELKGRVRELEDQLLSLRERTVRLVDLERRRCGDYIPSKESEPSDRETEIWKELQVTRVTLSRAEEELRLSRADKDSFLESLSQIAQMERTDKEDKMSAELVKKEQHIRKLQNIIEEQRENEKIMQHTMTDYENQLATLRLEVKRLRNYDCYTKDTQYQDLQTELLELQMQVETLSRERSALVSAAASRALMLERHERAADLFAKITRARKDLEAQLEDNALPRISDGLQAEISKSVSSICASSAETWSALKAERARVLRLESAVVSQSIQLERETRVRTQLERRRATLERELFRTRHDTSCSKISSNPNSTIFFP
ncbi:myosin heavy chain, non-muscle-like isoform X2 [Danaus plexippus]|uniref:myosin heavy chain, non-muscle-like isoform X2 n=1 Tax=Danaus plexippus TaxID=13037 RepID=UPI002AAF200D|nr:myosin heavy chain, non-muscle-like isoform X2 [Danaus plexippus]